MGTTLSLTAPENVFFINNSDSPKAMSIQLSYWMEELNFYHFLLKWSTFNGSDKTKIGALLAMIDTFRNGELPEMKRTLDAARKNREPQSINQMRLHADFQQLSRNLNNLKRSIFRVAGELVRVQIW